MEQVRLKGKVIFIAAVLIGSTWLGSLVGRQIGSKLLGAAVGFSLGCYIVGKNK
ncbi:MAG: hypothetical protein KME18_18185 [Phormidium tanganyikae FI6-MK23]|nr:hypothetical protein [Phormidium tanganyikae FI6-MK23]